MKEQARCAVERLNALEKTVATAESCTGGLIAKLITDVPGSSAVFPGGCVTYTNRIKQQLLGVEPAVFAKYTEVSHACAAAMATGVRKNLQTDYGISATGYAGPDGGTEQDPVGTVYLAVSSDRDTVTERFCATRGADRCAVREQAATRALQLLLEMLNREGEA